MEPRAGFEPATYSFLFVYYTRLLLYRLSYRGVTQNIKQSNILKFGVLSDFEFSIRELRIYYWLGAFEMKDILSKVRVRHENVTVSFIIRRYNSKADSHDKKLRFRHYLLGRMAFQCFQAMKKLDAICKQSCTRTYILKKVITIDAISFFTSNRIHVTFTDFKENWQHRIINQILELTTEK